MKRLITFLTMTAVCLLMHAQSRPVPIYDMPASARSLSTGGGSMGRQQSAYIYTNPSAAFAAEEARGTAEYLLALVDNKTGNMLLHTVTASHRWGSHLVMGGVRYYAQGSIDHALDINMKPVPGRLRLYAYTADLGYARRLGAFSVYGSLGLASEKAAERIGAYRANIGASFSHSLQSADYTVGLGIRDLGMVSYRGKNKRLAPLLHAGGSVTLPTWEGQALGVFVDGGMYLPSGKSKAAGILGAGLDYTFAKRYSLRAGGHTGGDRDNYLSAGLGVRVGRFTMDAAAKLACEDGLSNLYMAGMKFDF